jgi:subtilisin family serine protease
MHRVVALLPLPLLVLACGLSLVPVRGWEPPQDKALTPEKAPRRSLSPLGALRALKSAKEIRARGLAAPASQGELYAVLRAEFQDTAKCKAFALPGVHVLDRFERFATLFIKATDDQAMDRLEDMLASPSGRADADHPLVWLEPAGRAAAPPVPKVTPVAERPRGVEEIVRGGVELPGGRRLTGKGVLLAVIDTGIDFRNPEFTYLGEDGKPTSRLLYFWDTINSFEDKGIGGPGPLLYPNKAPIGVLYTRADLTRELRARERRIPDLDTHGHGTACAAIAAGNGQGSGKDYMGVAPGVDLVAVRLASGAEVANEFLLGAACAWLEGVAGDRPLVVTCSFGGHGGGHDGRTIEERELSGRFAPTRAGRALCIAAGNEAEDGLHAQLKLAPGGGKTALEWLFDPAEENKPSRAFLRLFVDGARSTDLQQEGGEEARLVEKYVNPLSKSWVFGYLVKPKGRLQLANRAERPLIVDAYIQGLDGQVRFEDELATRRQLIGSPGLAASAITVGSYDFNDLFPLRKGGPVRLPVYSRNKPRTLTVGELSAYSSPGHSRQGDLTKPDVVAPGQYHIVPSVKGTGELRDRTGKLTYFNGTSAATPYAAGVVTLLLEKNPGLTVGEIKDLLHQHATAGVAPVGKVPNPDWGFGKLDVAAVRRIVHAAPEPRR